MHAVSILIEISLIILNQIRNASNRKLMLLKIGYQRYNLYWVVHCMVVRLSQAIHTTTHQILVSIYFDPFQVRFSESPIYFHFFLRHKFPFGLFLFVRHFTLSEYEIGTEKVHCVLFVLIDQFVLEMEVEKLFSSCLEYEIKCHKWQWVSSSGLSIILQPIVPYFNLLLLRVLLLLLSRIWGYFMQFKSITFLSDFN